MYDCTSITYVIWGSGSGWPVDNFLMVEVGSQQEWAIFLVGGIEQRNVGLSAPNL